MYKYEEFYILYILPFLYELCYFVTKITIYNIKLTEQPSFPYFSNIAKIKNNQYILKHVVY